jgi:biopolymer transport protein TolR
MNAAPGASRPAGGSDRNAAEGAGFGRLERSSSAAPMSDINMTPLIDVMLVLLVIFIITAPLLVSSVRVDLPKAAGTSASQAPKFLVVTINPAGEIFVGDTLQTTEAMAGLMEQTAKANPEAELRLRADATVPYGRVVEVMGLAQKAGLSRIGFIADTPPAAHP